MNNKNSISVANQLFLKQWHPTKNGELKPDDVTCCSHKIIWWQCENKHEWATSPHNRKVQEKWNGNGCPHCHGLIACEQNNLAVLFPNIADEWDYTKNVSITPESVTAFSKLKAWFTCKNGHSYFSRISDRTKNGSGCPYCSNKRVCAGNCMETTSPKIAKQWHPTKNGKFCPSMVTDGSHKTAWWLCETCGYEWSAVIKSRKTRGCPNCNGKVVNSTNNLRNKARELCSEWDCVKNGETNPDNTFFSSNKKVWWLCNKNHSWMATVNSRVCGNGCPYCNGVLLKNGDMCDSMVEAVKYIEFSKNDVKFIFHKKYDGLGRHKCDFYIINDNKYVEVTGFTKKSLFKKPGMYFRYLRKIVKKKRYTENILHASFEFIQFVPTPKQIKSVRENMI